ncbi:MAG: S24/S26 family peptidase [Spirochaetales bacterium]|nr:S24/S26 family peptidase [Spirochaetales bacterium]
MLKIVKVSGDSMSPGINPGDLLLISTLPVMLGWLRIGWDMVFHSADYGLLVKKIIGFSPDKKRVFFKGSRPSSLSSDEMGPINVKDVAAVVLLIIPQNKSFSSEMAEKSCKKE